jgi:hypothetical protein
MTHSPHPTRSNFPGSLSIAHCQYPSATQHYPDADAVPASANLFANVNVGGGETCPSEANRAGSALIRSTMSMPANDTSKETFTC